jgi:hypothetical protein
MAKVHEIGKKHEEWLILRQHTNLQEDPANQIIVQPRTTFVLKFHPSEDARSNTSKQIPTDIKYIEVTDLIPQSARKNVLFDFSLGLIYQPSPSGSFSCRIERESYFIPYEEDPITFEFRPQNVLGERLPRTQEELDFFVTSSETHGSLRKWGSLQEAQSIHVYGQNASAEYRNIIVTQRLSQKIGFNQFDQNLIFATTSHTADTPLQLINYTLLVRATEINA